MSGGRRPADDGLRALVSRHLATWRGEVVHWTPLETAATVSGVPDLNGCWRGHEVWVECKATAHWAVSVSEFQVGWHRRRARAGGSTFVLVRRRLGAATARRGAFDELWLVPGTGAAALSRGGLRGVATAPLTAGGPERWDWEGVGVRLFGGNGPPPADGNWAPLGG